MRYLLVFTLLFIPACTNNKQSKTSENQTARKTVDLSSLTDEALIRSFILDSGFGQKIDPSWKCVTFGNKNTGNERDSARIFNNSIIDELHRRTKLSKEILHKYDSDDYDLGIFLGADGPGTSIRELCHELLIDMGEIKEE
jgi:hypothetical protein